MFSDEKALTTLAKENRTLLEKIHDFFKQFIDKLKDIKLKLSKSSAVYATINHDIDYLEQSAQKIRTMLDNVQNTNVQSKEKFSLDVNLSETDFESNIKKVANMKSVADLDGTGFSKGNTDLVTQVTEYFNSIGNKVDSKFGTIKLTRTGVKSSVAHGIGRNKAIAFKAVPDVLKHGEIIDYTENYKNRGYDTAVFSAPFSINNEPFYMAAVVNVEAEKNQYYLHEISVETKKDTLPFKTGTVNDGTPSDNVSSIYTLLEKLQDVNTKYSKNTLDSEGNELTEQQQEYFKDSKVRDDDGNLQVVYHGTTEDFTVFDKTKGRANMDIQGMFFSPWELDAQGYGSNVKAYYLNITNPAPGQVGYKALNMFKGQNNAGIKAREYLESLGYDGVNNYNEEYIAFNSNQIKLVDNLNPTDKSDIRYSKDTLEAEYIKAVDNGNEKEAEKALKSYAMQWGAYSLDGKAPLELYHGTQSFGFTEFDLNRMDDKRSIFLTDDIDTAQSYSGVYDVKKIAEGNFVDYDKMSMKELANELSKYDDEFVNYKYYSKQDIQKTINEANNKIKEVIKIGLPLVKNNSYSDYYSESSIIGDTDFSNPDVSNFLFWQADELKKQSLTIKEILDSYGYKFDLARRYYSDHEIINEMEENNGVIIAEYKSKGSVHPYFRDYAIDRLKNYNGDSRGNYKLYAKLNNPLVVDAEGRKWNDIRYKSPTEKYIVDEAQYNKGKFQVTDVSVNQPIWIDGTLYFDNAEEAKNALNSYLKSNNKDNKYYKYLNFTRDVAEYASNQGYDGVVFKNIVDYGGEGALSGVADNIIVAFDNKNVKSADTITYDDNGEVIPLSKRFSDKSDIRYSKDTNVDEFDYANYNEIKLGKKEYAIVSSAIVTKFTNKYSDELRSINYGDYIYSFVYNEDGVKFYERYNIDKYLKGLNEYGIYRKSKDNNRLSGLLKFAERDNSSSFGGNENRKSTGNVNSFDRETLSAEEKSNGIGYIENVDNDKQSRNTRLTLDDNIEDVNEAFLSAVKVLQNVHIDDIDLSSEVVTKAENAAKHIQNEVKKSGYRTQKLTGKGSVRSIATDLSEKYGNGKVTKSLVSELAELYDYIANSEIVK